MNVSELKQKSTTELYDVAAEMGIDNINRAKREQVVFNILKAAAKKGEELYGGGVLEILQDGFGFYVLRAAHIWLGLMMFIFRRVRFVVFTCVPVTPS